MKSQFIQFNKLDQVRATSISSMVRGKLQILPQETLVKDHLIDGDEVVFQIDSINFWIKLSYQMHALT